MELSTSLNIAMKMKGYNTDPDFTVQMQLDDMKQIGFRCFDFNFVDYTLTKGCPFLGEEWEQWVNDIREYASLQGQRFYQSHGHMFEIEQLYSEEMNQFLIPRAIHGSAVLGVQWIVYHPYYNYDRITSKRMTYERFARLKEMTEKEGVGLAVENMPFPDKYCGQVEELLELAEKFDLGICWDTSHANLTGYTDQSVPLKQIGGRLKAVHISDNLGSGDDHLAPFYGNIAWDKVMEGLKAVDYQGTFNYEAHNFVRKIPFELRLQPCKLLYDIGLSLLK